MNHARPVAQFSFDQRLPALIGDPPFVFRRHSGRRRSGGMLGCGGD